MAALCDRDLSERNLFIGCVGSLVESRLGRVRLGMLHSAMHSLGAAHLIICNSRVASTATVGRMAHQGDANKENRRIVACVVGDVGTIAYRFVSNLFASPCSHHSCRLRLNAALAMPVLLAHIHTYYYSGFEAGLCSYRSISAWR